MDSILKLENVTKIYGDRIVVNNVSLEIKKGCIFGLLGPNGAGKTTIMKIIMNQVKCDRGNVVCDENLKVKYLQDVPKFYEFYTIEEYLHFILDITHYNKDKMARISEVLQMLNLNDYKDYKIKKLSRGLRQKVGIASVILDEPDILILDEPVSALDPLGRKEIFDIMLSLKGKVTIVFSSHILADIERVCDHIIMISKGKIILNKSINDLSLERKTLQITFKDRADLIRIKENVDSPTRFSETIKDCLEIDGEDLLSLESKIFYLLADEKVEVKSIAIKNESLEEIFLREVKNNV